MINKRLDEWKFCLDTSGAGTMPGPDAEWEDVEIPHDYQIYRPMDRDVPGGGPQGFFSRWGTGWYRRQIDVPEVKENRRYLLHFGGVYEKASVYINGALAGRHNYGYSEFTVDVTEFLRAGSNAVAVCADNSAPEAPKYGKPGETFVPTDRWYGGAGIYRPVVLREVPTEYIREEEVKIAAGYSDGKGSLAVSLAGHGSAEVSLEEIPGLQEGADRKGHTSRIVPPTFFEGSASFENLTVLPWSAENPSLYLLRIRLDSNGYTHEMRIGFRTVIFDSEKGLLVNGNPVKIKGVCLHHDAGAVGSAVTKPLLREKLRVLKSVGCNGIRTSHNIHSADLLDLADEMGFYVLDECFDKWISGSYSRFYDSDVQADLSSMIFRDRNRPSVLMWSVGNEVDDQGAEPMLKILRRLVGIAHSLDSRPVTVAMSPHYKDIDGNSVDGNVPAVIDSIARIAAEVDVIGCNYQEMWYDAIREKCPSKLILGTETYLYFRGSYDHYFNYSQQNPWLDVVNRDYVIGCSLWAGYDYLGESLGYPSKGWAGALLQNNMDFKPITWLWKSFWSDEPTVHISILDYTKPMEMVREPWSEMPLSDCWNYPMFSMVPLPYMIFTNCEEVRLSLNGKYFDIPRPSECVSGIIQGFVPKDEGVLKVEGVVGGKVVCEHSIRTCGETARLAFTRAPQSFAWDGSPAQILLTAEAQDAEGVRDCRYAEKITFRTEGPVRIEGVESGYLCDDQPMRADSVRMNEGHASVIVRVLGTGKAAVEAVTRAGSARTEFDITDGKVSAADTGNPEKVK
ncbi:MAG: glycoside hydrolase family 2 TIM barrel-domain containing protein [Lachnospiraceae bacterium]